VSLYIHIPYCEAKCHYCDFNSYAGREAEFEAFTAALCRDLERSADELIRHEHLELPLRSVFLGGGTPSVLPAPQVDRILRTARRLFGFSSSCELTSEANPGSLSEPYLEVLAGHGLSRLSLGVQSLDDAQLRALGRVHTREVALEAVALARRMQVPALSLDLIFGIPHQDMRSWLDILDEVLALRTEHLSLYGLIIEPTTVFGRLHREQRLQVPDDDVQAEMFAETTKRLSRWGYEHYEVSNYAQPGHRCQHNLGYWDNAPYLGVGPGAVSYLGGWRTTRCRRPADYIRQVMAGESVVVEAEHLSHAAGLSESLMLGLRRLDGVDLTRVWARHALPGLPYETFEELLLELCRVFVEAGWLELQARCLRLTAAGVETSNFVFEKLLELPEHLEGARLAQRAGPGSRSTGLLAGVEAAPGLHDEPCWERADA
jgi:oxygen-independent coproporphyrinogen III oxidase